MIRAMSLLPAKNSHMRMRNEIKTNRDKSSILNFIYNCYMNVPLALIIILKFILIITVLTHTFHIR